MKTIRKDSYYSNSQLVCLSLIDTYISVTDRFKLLCTPLSFEVSNDFYKTKPELPDSAILHTKTHLKDIKS